VKGATNMPSETSLDAAFKAASPRIRKQKCIVGRAIDENTEGEVIERYINDLRWSAPAINRVLRGRGIEVSASAITLHRRTTCGCYSVRVG
jgi:hypothetical protein